jgi:hypothetical protein
VPHDSKSSDASKYENDRHNAKDYTSFVRSIIGVAVVRSEAAAAAVLPVHGPCPGESDWFDAGVPVPNRNVASGSDSGGHL